MRLLSSNTIAPESNKLLDNFAFRLPTLLRRSIEPAGKENKRREEQSFDSTTESDHITNSQPLRGSESYMSQNWRQIKTAEAAGLLLLPPWSHDDRPLAGLPLRSLTDIEVRARAIRDLSRLLP